MPKLEECAATAGRRAQEDHGAVCVRREHRAHGCENLVGYARGLGLTCFGLRSDLRLAGEPGVALNLQVESLIVASGGAIVDSLVELVAALKLRGADA